MFWLSDNRLGKLCLLGFFIALSVWATWPVARSFERLLPTGDSPTATVPMLNAWILWWNSLQPERAFQGYWDAPIFHPQPGSLGLSEPQPATLVVAPVSWWLGPIAAYNCYLWLALTLNGVFAFRFLRFAGCQRITALSGATAVQLHPLALHNLEAFQLISLWTCLWAVQSCAQLLSLLSAHESAASASDRATEHHAPSSQSPSSRPAALWIACGQLAVASAVTLLICIHHACFLCILLAGCCCLVPLRHWPRLLLPGMTTACLPLLVAWLVIWPMLQIHRDYAFARDPQVVRTLSASLTDWLTVAGWSWSPLEQQALGQPLNPGWWRCAFALLICVPLANLAKPTVRCWLLIASLSFFFSFGANWNIGGWRPWEWLSDWISPASRIRSPYRFAYFTQLAIIMLGALSLDSWWQELRQRVALGAPTRLSHWARAILPVGGVGLLLLFALESVPSRTFTHHPPHRDDCEPWVQYVRDHSRENTGLVCLPTARDFSEQAWEQETRWMMYATQHGRPILNGYSGFIPPLWSELRPLLVDGQFTPALIAQLVDTGQASLVVVRTDRISTNLPEMSQQLASIQLVFEDQRYQIWKIGADGDRRSKAPPTKTIGSTGISGFDGFGTQGKVGYSSSR